MSETKEVRNKITPDTFWRGMASWELAEWFRWPPDVFALTSNILGETGLYRFAVAHGTGAQSWPEGSDQQRWRRKVKAAANLWLQALHPPAEEEVAKEWNELLAVLREGRSQVPSESKESMKRLVGESVAELWWRLETSGTDVGELRRVNRLAKEQWGFACTLLELHAIADEACAGLGFPSRPGTEARAAFHYVANRLLVECGTLSRLPTHKGLVLPKLRTPSVGLTLRSLSHHVTYHRSEVDITWRSIPWFNQEEGNLNVLVVPLPMEIQPRSFVPRTVRGVRFFEYEPGSTGDPVNKPERIVSLVREAQRHVRRVHVVVLPELCLSSKELEDLLVMLEKTSEIDHEPIVISGVRSSNGESDPEFGRNEVRLSVYFGGAWYTQRQHKHHRWRLEQRQIETYNLAGSLSAQEQWWEAIELPRRELNFLAPNGWLSLAPLICEDLARLEPVSDLIRGVGPTLVVAVLLDGPQLKERWSARYASVLADDPGSSVLTVTSLGMALRSCPEGCRPRRVVALWSDGAKGDREIELEEGREGVLLTLSARWREEITADGRTDGGAAAELILHGVTQLSRSDREAGQQRDQFGIEERSKSDLKELSLFAFLVDHAVVAPRLYRERLQHWASKALGGVDWPPDLTDQSGNPPGEDLQTAIGMLTKLVGQPGDKADYQGLAEEAMKKTRGGLERSSRLDWMVSIAVLWAIHNELADERRCGRLGLTSSQLLRGLERFLSATMRGNPAPEL